MSIQILTTAANAVLPIVALIFLGYFLRQKGFLTDNFLSVGNKLVFRVCLPVMLFVNVYGIGSISDIRWDICLYSVAGVREQMIHGETGWIVENNAQAIYEGLRQLLDDPELRESLRSNAGMDAVCGNEEKYRQLMSLCE